jgi:hypothetical protein
MYPTRQPPPMAVQVFVDFALRCLENSPFRGN